MRSCGVFYGPIYTTLKYANLLNEFSHYSKNETNRLDLQDVIAPLIWLCLFPYVALGYIC